MYPVCANDARSNGAERNRKTRERMTRLRAKQASDSPKVKQERLEAKRAAQERYREKCVFCLSEQLISRLMLPGEIVPSLPRSLAAGGGSRLTAVNRPKLRPFGGRDERVQRWRPPLES
jgi:hypothetical protein